MYNIQQVAEQKNDIKFDEEISCIKLRYKNLKEVFSKEKKVGDTIRELSNLKLQVSALSTKNASRNQAKKELMIKLCEQIIALCIKENKPKEAMKSISELDIIQDILKEKNTKALFYKARCYLLLNDLKQAYHYFKIARELVDGDLKDEIDSILNRIKAQGTFDEDSDSDDISLQVSELKEIEFNPSIASTSTRKQLDLNLIPINVDTEDTESVESQPVDKKCTKVKAKLKVPKDQTVDSVEICILKPASTILSEFMTKFVDTTPVYEVDEIKLEKNNTKIFTMSCYCIGHSETGCGLNKKTAKEVASQKMIKYLEALGKLKLKNAADV